MKTKRRVPAKNHPWKKFSPFTSKPASLSDYLGYIVESEYSKKPRNLISSRRTQ